MEYSGGGNPADYGWDEDSNHVPASAAEGEKPATAKAKARRTKAAKKQGAGAGTRRRRKKEADKGPLEPRVEKAILQICEKEGTDGEIGFNACLQALAKMDSEFDGQEKFQVVSLLQSDDGGATEWAAADERPFGYDEGDNVFFLPEE